jgi:3-hydroxy-9,10-secoandrosta-1,3,5(10)-triene-9,17-dione monooxygenase
MLHAAFLSTNPARPLGLMAARATDLVPGLKTRAGEANRLRRMPDANLEAMRAAGLTRILQPARCGGLELSLHDHLDAVAAIAEGCGSTGWCLGVYHAHEWLMGLFGQQAQDDVYSGKPDALVGAVLVPKGVTEWLPRGFRVSGTWGFCSGVHHSDWAILGAMAVHPSTGREETALMLVPRADFAVKEDWVVTGLSGTGSNSVVVEGAVVPEHRVLWMAEAGEGRAPGAALHASSLYRSAMVPALALFISSPALGMARHALRAFVDRLPGRVVAYTFGEKQRDMAITHIQLAEVATRIDTAHTILHAMIDEIEHHAAAGKEMPMVRRAKARMDCAYAVRLCLDAVETLHYASGGSALAETNEIQLAARDIRAANMHGVLHLETTQEMYGRVLLGLPPSSPVI